MSIISGKSHHSKTNPHERLEVVPYLPHSSSRSHDGRHYASENNSTMSGKSHHSKTDSHGRREVVPYLPRDSSSRHSSSRSHGGRHYASGTTSTTSGKPHHSKTDSHGRHEVVPYSPRGSSSRHSSSHISHYASERDSRAIQLARPLVARDPPLTSNLYPRAALEAPKSVTSPSYLYQGSSTSSKGTLHPTKSSRSSIPPDELRPDDSASNVSSRDNSTASGYPPSHRTEKSTVSGSATSYSTFKPHPPRSELSSASMSREDAEVLGPIIEGFTTGVGSISRNDRDGRRDGRCDGPRVIDTGIGMPAHIRYPTPPAGLNVNITNTHTHIYNIGSNNVGSTDPSGGFIRLGYGRVFDTVTKEVVDTSNIDRHDFRWRDHWMRGGAGG